MTPALVMQAVADVFGIRVEEQTGPDRHRRVALARHVAMYLVRQLPGFSYPDIGQVFGQRDHTTVMSAIRKIEAARKTDARLRALIETLEERIGIGPVVEPAEMAVFYERPLDEPVDVEIRERKAA